MNVLITGGSGFLAGRLAEYLNKYKYEIYLASRNLEKLKSNYTHYHKKEIDWNNKSSIESACENIDVILHTAGYNSTESVRNPDEAALFSRKGTKILIGSALKAKVKRIIFLSTVHVYSNPLEGIINENTKLKNTHPYALSNIEGEIIINTANKNTLIDGIILRLANIYGKPIAKNSIDWTLLFNDICLQAITTGRVKLKSTGEQKRDFLPANGFCRVIEYFLSEKKNKKIENIYNVATGQSIKILDFVKLVLDRYKKLSGLDIPILLSDHYTDNSDYLIETNRLIDQGLTIDYNHEDEIDSALKYFMSILP